MLKRGLRHDMYSYKLHAKQLQLKSINKVTVLVESISVSLSTKSNQIDFF